MRSIASLVPESWSGDPESKRHQVYTHTLRAASALDNFTYVPLGRCPPPLALIAHFASDGLALASLRAVRKWAGSFDATRLLASC